MAPEIGAGEKYKGNRADVFSLGVTLFTLVNGIFPFTASRKEDDYYSFIANNDMVGYWAEV
jgi:serine/threonine protein kinase